MRFLARLKTREQRALGSRPDDLRVSWSVMSLAEASKNIRTSDPALRDRPIGLLLADVVERWGGSFSGSITDPWGKPFELSLEAWRGSDLSALVLRVEFRFSKN